MMLEKGQRLLLPVNPWFIWGSLLVALLINLLPYGRTPWGPDVLLLTVLFWCLHQPAHLGVGLAFVFGLIMDVHHTNLLGMHAMGYALAAYLISLAQRRMLWFSPWLQTPQVFGIMLLAHALIWLLRLAGSGQFPGWSLLGAPLLETALWPLLSLLLLAPQRRAPDRDLTRPL